MLYHNTCPLKSTLTAATAYEILTPLILHPVLLSSPICVPENVGVNKKDRIQKKKKIFPSAVRV
jgi:hypothetical protein